VCPGRTGPPCAILTREGDPTLPEIETSFVHLHVHSEYSLLDGFCRLPQLVHRTKQLGMPAVALTDHGTLYGAVDFYRLAVKEGIKPIIGLEAYLAPRGMQDRDPHFDSQAFHLLLLAENDTGYRNLLKIASAAQLEGFYYRPRIDHDYLAAHSEGLICTTGCLKGEVPRALADERLDAAARLLDYYFEIFGVEHFFFELQDHAIPDLERINRSLIDLAPRYQARFVATNDVHYLDRDDAALQDILLCVQTSAALNDPNRMRMSDDSYYLRTAQEMRSLFGHVPGAIENTLAIAERCQVDLSFKGYHLPDFQVPEGFSLDSYLRQQSELGLRQRYQERATDPALRARLEHELAIIHQMGFDAYFLIVWDLCRFARQQGIWYSARGSASGSLVAYCLGITPVDPIQHNLIFERFLNPGRVSMPDIDLDFQDDRRGTVLEYTSAKYGRDHVAQIITFGTLGARAAIRDVGRVLEVPLPEVDRVAKLLPWSGGPGTIAHALEEVPDFRDAYDSSPPLNEMIRVAAHLEGLPRNPGTHAAGVVITPGPLVDYIPVHRPPSGQDEGTVGVVTQFEMNALDYLGLLKVDLLGLSTLTVMARACEMIRERHGIGLNLDTIPLDDPKTYELLGKGEVVGIFQVEGAGMRRFLMEMKPTRVDDVIAMVALYRPGPMDFIPSYIRRMHGEEKVDYRHPALEPIFRETYGVPVYQEQVMTAAVELAGYSAAEADYLRKAISKKEAEELQKHRTKFIEGAEAKGMPKDTAASIFEDWENFARYGFNRAHAAAYGTLAAQTAYLKANYPIEYMVALLSVFRGNADKTAGYIADCRRMGIPILPPDVNASGIDFQIEPVEQGREGIRFGLGAIKNVGDGSASLIVDALSADGRFASLDDLASRVDLRQVGKRAMESLIRVGALEALGSRAGIEKDLDGLLRNSGAHHATVLAGQKSLFAGVQAPPVNRPAATPEAPVAVRKQLEWEKELLGVYVTDHPLNAKLPLLSKLVTHWAGDLEAAAKDEVVIVAGEIVRQRSLTTKNGDEMAFAALEDHQGSIELVLFPKVWKEVHSWFDPGKIVVAKGRIDRDRGEPKVLVDKVTDQIEKVRVVPR